MSKNRKQNWKTGIPDHEEVVVGIWQNAGDIWEVEFCYYNKEKECWYIGNHYNPDQLIHEPDYWIEAPF